MKKVIALALALMLILSLAACGTASSQSSAAAEESTAAKSEPAASESAAEEPAEEEPAEEEASVLPITEEVTEFNIWTKNFRCFEYYDGFSDCLWWQELENRTNIHINWTEYGSSVPSAEGFALIISGGEWESYDALVDVGTLYNGGEMQAYVDEIVIDLKPYLEEYAPDYLNLLNSNDVYARDTYTASGEMLAMYRLWDTDKLPIMGLCMRADWLEDVGMDAPVTYDDMHDVLTAFKVEKGADAAWWLNKDCCNVGGMMGAGYGVDTFYGASEGLYLFFNKDGTACYSPCEEGYREYVQMLHDWYAEGLIYQDFMAYTEPMLPDMELLASGRTGLLNGMVDMMGMFEMNTEGGSWMGVSNPVKEEGDQTHFQFQAELTNAGQGLYITTVCENPEILVEWANYLYTEDGSFFKRYGIEGESFDYVDGVPTLNKEKIYDDERWNGFSEAGIDMYLGGDCWGLDSNYPRIVTYSEAQQQALEIWTEHNDGAWTMPSGVSLTADETQEWTDIFNDIDTYVSETVSKFVVGEKDMSEWDEFVAQMKDMNIDRCIEIWQAALDRYYGVA